jgi:ABC transport system ATP-binding/permease protein
VSAVQNPKPTPKPEAQSPMPLVTLTDVSLAFGHLPLLDHAELRIDDGERIALIGRNGSGKSSLLKVLSGELTADSGNVWRTPALRIGRLDQEIPAWSKPPRGDSKPAPPPDDSDAHSSVATGPTVFDEIAGGLGPLADLVTTYHHGTVAVAERPDDEDRLHRLAVLQQALEREDGWRIEQKVELVISRLGLPADRPVNQLSGGWRRRTLLAKALVSQPNLLLLDEPTNHLDIDAIRWLEEFLAEFNGTVMFVTHDRAFLSTLATRIIQLDRGKLTSWPGSYGAYLQNKAAALENEARDLERLDRKLAQEEAWLRQGIKARRTRNEGRVRALLKLRADRAARRAHMGDVRMGIDPSQASGKLVFEAKGVSKSYGAAPVILDYSQRILRGDRVGLIGANGSGKTTLLRLLVGEIEPDAGAIRHGTRLQIAYFDQQREQLDPDRTVADTINDGNTTVVVNGQSRHVLGYLADFLFPRERAQSPVRSLSGGERNRLLLARLFAKPANVLVLDEPTNDLDIETLELLEELVSEFRGTVLLVSHDRVFVERVVTSTLAFEGAGRVTEYIGGYEDYVRQRLSTAGIRNPGSGIRKEDAERRRPVRGTETSAEVTASSTKPRRLSYNERRELDGLPGRIAALEEEQKRLQEESLSADFYKSAPDHIHAVLARIVAAGEELDQLLGRWMELEGSS